MNNRFRYRMLDVCGFQGMNATVAQLVEYDLAKVGVAGSSPVCRSLRKRGKPYKWCATRQVDN